ncbi:poly(A) polymerase [Streptomyces sp. NPDC054961]
MALSAVSDAEAVRAFVGPDHAAFARLAREVKAWARSRGLDSAPFGGLPGLAWTVLAAHTVHNAPDLSPGPLLHAFFATWAAWDWRVPVALSPAPAPDTDPHTDMDAHAGTGTGMIGDGDGDGDSDSDSDGNGDALTVLTPSAPVRSCTTQVGPGLRDLLVRELYAAWEALDAGSGGGSAPGPASPHRRHAAWAVVTVTGTGPGEFEENLGRTRGRMRALLGVLSASGLTEAHAWPRPFDRTPVLARYAVGLGATPPDATALAGLTGPWSATLPGTDVTWAECGSVPDLF